MKDHVYGCPSDPNDGLVIVHPGVPDGFGGVVPGVIWCWSHVTWEPIPDSWHDLEELLRAEIETEWRHIRADDQLVFQSPRLAALFGEYCGHRGWRRPDMGDRYNVFRFMDDLKERAPVR